MTNLLAFIFVISILVFVHEFGHFMMARRIGVRVLTFSLGFGPKLLKFTRGDTEYCLSAIPLGGYVKMAGENPNDKRSGSDEEFLSKSKWQRFQVLVMGPTMNIVLALVVMTFVLYQGDEVPAYEQEPAVIGSVVADSPAERVGIKVGEEIVEVEGRAIETWQQLFMAVMPRAEREISIVARNSEGRRRTLLVKPDAETEFKMGNIGVGPVMRPQILGVTNGEPADQAGILRGDVIEELNGEPVDRDQLIERINASAGEPVHLTVRRGNQREGFVVTPALTGDVGLIGVSISAYEVRIIEPTFFQAGQMSLQRNLTWSGLIFQTLWGLVTAETSPRQLMGPVGIAQLSGASAQIGWVALFSLMSMISLNLGILNLLPIPVLDGGHIFIMALEGISQHDFSIRMKERMLLAGFVVLMMLMVTVIYNDLTRISWIEDLMIWR